MRIGHKLLVAQVQKARTAGRNRLLDQSRAAINAGDVDVGQPARWTTGARS